MFKSVEYYRKFCIGMNFGEMDYKWLIIPSRARGWWVTYIKRDMGVGLDTWFDTHRLQFLRLQFTVYNAFTITQSAYSSLHAHFIFLVCWPSPVLVHGLPTADSSWPEWQQRPGTVWFLDNPTALIVFKHPTHLCPFCQGQSPRGLANLMGVSRIYVVIHPVGPSIVLAQQKCLRTGRWVLQTPKILFDIVVFQIGGGGGSPAWLDNRGPYRGLLSMMSSIQDPNGYLSVALEGPGFVDYFRRMGLWVRFYQVTFYSKGTL
jgi:hypothetical protein